MGTIAMHDIVVHYKVTIPNIDPDRYSYIDLLNDVVEKALNEMPENLNLLLHMRCGIPRTFATMDVTNDKTVLEMFKAHENEVVINLYVLHMDIIPPEDPNNVINKYYENDQEIIGINNQVGRDAPHNYECDEIDDVNEIHSSSSDESWKQQLSSDQEVRIGDERVAFSSTDNSDNEFYGFEDNEDGVAPDSESDQEQQRDYFREAMRGKMWTYNPKEDIEFEKGMLFTNVDAFRAALKDYVIQKAFPIKRLKNEKTRCTATCGVEGCPWRIHASPIGDSMTFQIKSYNPQHTCVIHKENQEATSDWIAKKLIGVLRDHLEMSNKGVFVEMRKYGVQPSKMQVWRAKMKALNAIEGTHYESYGKLPKYAEILRQHNQESICKIHYDRPNLLVEPRFLRLFISFKAQKDGFLAGCRPFVSFDGCHLKGPFGGVLLTAVALDVNNGLFPLAFAVSECENKNTWSWFFEFFEQFFGPFGNNVPLTFMSDRQKGLNLAYEEKVPSADARYCCRHIYSNFKSSFPGLLLRNYFWQAAKSFDEVSHNEAMEGIKEINIEAWKYLVNIPKSAWARYAFSEAITCDHVTNNFTESFNAWIGDLRGKPILTLADGLRRKFMKKLHKRFQKGCTWTSKLTPNIVDKLKLIGDQSRKCELMMASENVFEVLDLDRTYIVKLEDKSCECCAFQLTGLPCKHAALGIIYRREKLEDYCHHSFSREFYLKTYAPMINPIPHETRWPPMLNVTPTTVLPPLLRREPGRPKKNRRREADEGASSNQTKRSTIFKCSNCGSFGHNKRTCKGGPVNKNRGGTSNNQKSDKRVKPGRGLANTGLAGSVLWNHAIGKVPVVFSTKSSNLIPLNQRERSSKKAGTSQGNTSRGRIVVNQTPASQNAISESINAAGTLGSF